MEKSRVLEFFQALLLEHTPEELKAWLIEAIGGAVAGPVESPILAPYKELLAAEAEAIQKLRGHIGDREPNIWQRKMLEAYDTMVAWFDKLVEVGGDITLAGEIPRRQWIADDAILLAWGGVDPRNRIVVYIDGTVPFRATTVSPFIHDTQAILNGATDPTGEYWKKYNIQADKNGIVKTSACWNAEEMTDAYKPTEGDDDLDLIRNFDLSKGSLRYNPQHWPEPFRSAWFEGHPDYKFSGKDVRPPGMDHPS